MVAAIARAQPVAVLKSKAETPDLRGLPSVDRLLKAAEDQGLFHRFGRSLTADAVRAAIDQARTDLRKGGGLTGETALLDQVHQLLADWTSASLRPVINASGVILHTNLGRAPLSREAIAAVQAAAGGYSNLEFDLAGGRRGARESHVESLIVRLTGAEAALVVNNNAGAILLALAALASRRKVVIARTQLIEIGGGFRIPDVLKESGARLVEIGTTNRVHLDDYRSAIAAEGPALVLSAHHSNFRIVGFTAEPGREEIAALAHENGIASIEDLGSGTLLDTARYGLAHEPTVQESLAAGVDLATFSGDKLLGGPQAGILAGRADLLKRIRKHPLARALRTDKLTLAALQATLLHYLKGEAETVVPVWQMIAAPLAGLEIRARGWLEALGTGELIAGESTVGGGSLPGEALPTLLLALTAASADRTAQRLRLTDPPVIARTQDGRILLDPRTVLPDQDERLISILKEIG